MRFILHDANSHFLIVQFFLIFNAEKIAALQIALVNRYVLVPRMSASGSQAESLILRTTQAEIGLGALALLAVSLFATWEPY